MTIRFENVTALSGISDFSTSWGSAWVDFNKDGFADLWINNHHDPGKLYLNQGDGTFQDITVQVFPQGEKGDTHGSVWADLDNDGDPDLLQGADAGGGLQIYVNRNGVLTNEAIRLGIDRNNAFDRGVVVYDYNRDGLLDIVALAAPNLIGPYQSEIYQQQPDNTFVPVGQDNGFTPPTFRGPSFGILSDISNNNQLDLLVSDFNPAFSAYQSNGLRFENISSQLMPAIQVGSQDFIGDLVSGDFNGDLQTDLFVTQYRRGQSDVRQIAPRQIRAKFDFRQGEQGISFQSADRVRFEILGQGRFAPGQFQSIPLDRIFIGASGVHPTALNFSLDPNNTSFQGLAPHVPGTDQGIYIGFQPRTNTWEVRSSNPNREIQGLIIRGFNTSAPFQNVKALGFDPNASNVPAQLLLNNGDQFIDASQDSGINSFLNSGVSAVSGDFDNDMDLDLYVVQTGTAANRPNVLLENDGQGNFQRVVDGNAAFWGSPLGLGDSVTTVDYDLDGFLDLFLSNGSWPLLGLRAGPTSNDIPTTASGGPYQLIRNKGNTNHWLKLDLIGEETNQDAIGAKVFVTAGGVRQVREQNAGIHNRSQNDSQLHFGLANHSIVSQIEIFWPSGRKQILNNVQADQILRVVEDVQNPGTGLQRIRGTARAERLLGTSNRDVITGFNGNDAIQAKAGNDNLLGGNGNDTLEGWDGNDLLVGGKGNDVLTGGKGQDKFLFDSLEDTIDTITDFATNQDEIRIKAVNFGGGLEAGSISANQFAFGSSATLASHRFIYNQTTGDLAFDPDGSESEAAKTFVTLKGAPTLIFSDLKLV